MVCTSCVPSILSTSTSHFLHPHFSLDLLVEDSSRPLYTASLGSRVVEHNGKTSTTSLTGEIFASRILNVTMTLQPCF